VVGVEIGSYADYRHLIDTVVTAVENGKRGSKCPTLVMHSDCDGVWSPQESARLLSELDLIEKDLSLKPPIAFNAKWEEQVARKHTRPLWVEQKIMQI
jgi:hypothetical protein